MPGGPMGSDAHIYFCMPIASGLVKSSCATSVARMAASIAGNGIRLTIADPVEGYSIADQRNLIAHQFLASGATHLLMVDWDMEFDPDLVETLLSYDQDVIGAPYNMRAIDLMAIKQALVNKKPVSHAIMAGHCYALDLPAIRHGELVEVTGAGLGLCLITRKAFETIRAKVPLQSRRVDGGWDAGNARQAFDVDGYFDHMPQSDGRPMLSEDYSFCARWRQAGGKIMLWPDARVIHWGEYGFGVPFRQAMQVLM
jgi:hypothetical protein